MRPLLHLRFLSGRLETWSFYGRCIWILLEAALCAASTNEVHQIVLVREDLCLLFCEWLSVECAEELLAGCGAATVV